MTSNPLATIRSAQSTEDLNDLFFGRLVTGAQRTAPRLLSNSADPGSCRQCGAKDAAFRPRRRVCKSCEAANKRSIYKTLEYRYWHKGYHRWNASRLNAQQADRRLQRKIDQQIRDGLIVQVPYFVPSFGETDGYWTCLTISADQVHLWDSQKGCWKDDAYTVIGGGPCRL